MAIVTVDFAGRILFGNAKLTAMFGFAEDELIGQSIELLIPERFHQRHVGYRDDYVRHPRNRPMGIGLELLARHKNGAEFPIEVGLSTIQIAHDQVTIATIYDVTLRKRAEEELERRVEERTRELERRRQVADGLRDILTILNSNRPSGEILNYIVAQASRLLHADASAIYRLHDDQDLSLVIQTSHGLPDDYIAWGKRGLDQGINSQAVLTRQPVAISDLAQYIHLGSDPDSEARWEILLAHGYHAVLAVPLVLKDDVYGSLVLYYIEPRNFPKESIDLAVTFADQAALGIENARLRTQVEQAAIVAERNRLARDLHDSVTQTLFSASLIAEVLPKLWHRRHTEGERRLEELRQLTRGALAEMRTLLLELRPSRLIDVGLNELLRQLTEAVTGRARIPIDLQLEGECSLLPEVQIALYRTAQEALNNVAKHSQATRAQVKLICQSDYVKLTIGDDGRGFNRANVRANSLGLTIMHERAEAINGELEINSELDYGTEISLTWINKTAKSQDSLLAED
ncbi:MAG: PAS domain S-box protein [Anaerolineae bacterium]|nr:PAS domain S-box protein [Anaerolineae bacterium]MCB0178858.1 PAS domain S-box protein [Anaerolineae bacterium]MCB0223592.1 PAS domain S-box protein [Anaerolineae bacterium]MCB9106491.1 PAS domain S-box protein [Anaerolineales bacterium]